jgi:hypothetical protein
VSSAGLKARHAELAALAVVRSGFWLVCAWREGVPGGAGLTLIGRGPAAQELQEPGDLHGARGTSRVGGFQERSDPLPPLGEAAEEAPK